MSYPTAQDLVAFCNEAGLPAPSLPRAEAMLSETIAMLEGETGYRPFLAGANPETRIFEAPGPGRLLLDLGSGLVSVDWVRLNGAVVELEAAVRLLPTGAPAWTLLALPTPIESGQIEVRGRWGRVTSVPDDVAGAVLRQAALGVRNALTAGSGSVTSMQQGDVSIRYGESASWQDEFLSVVGRYRRTSF